jgi:hypothetical protein
MIRVSFRLAIGVRHATLDSPEGQRQLYEVENITYDAISVSCSHQPALKALP